MQAPFTNHNVAWWCVRVRSLFAGYLKLSQGVTRNVFCLNYGSISNLFSGGECTMYKCPTGPTMEVGPTLKTQTIYHVYLSKRVGHINCVALKLVPCLLILWIKLMIIHSICGALYSDAILCACPVWIWISSVCLFLCPHSHSDVCINKEQMSIISRIHTAGSLPKLKYIDELSVILHCVICPVCSIMKYSHFLWLHGYVHLTCYLLISHIHSLFPTLLFLLHDIRGMHY